MKISGIYQIQSKIKPSRIYIGSASNIRMRRNAHLSNLRKNIHHAIKLQNHYNKYGEDDLVFSILVGCNNDKKSLLETEQFMIDFYKPYFNSCPLAKSRKGSRASKETCDKISKALIGNQWCVGIKHDEEFCRKSSENRKKNWQDPEYRKKVSDGLKESHRRKKEQGIEDLCIKALINSRAKINTPEAKAKRLASFKKTMALKKKNLILLIN